MEIAWSLLYLAILLAAGYALFCAVAGGGRRGIVEVLGVSATLGAGAVGLLLIWLSMLGVLPGRMELTIIGLIALIAIVALARSNELIVPTCDCDWRRLLRREPASLLPLIFIGYLVFVAIGRSFTLPVLEWDAYAIWQLKAKVLATATLRSSPSYFTDVSLSFSHLRYPLLLPMLSAGAYGMFGQIDDRLGKCVLPLLCVAMGAIIYSGVRQRAGRLIALICAAMLMALPGLLRWSDSGTADLPLACFYAAGILFLTRWLENHKISDLLLATLFSGFAAMTKNEGVALAAINAVVLIACPGPGSRRPGIAAATLLSAGVALMILPWQLWSRDLPRTETDYVARLSEVSFIGNLSRIGKIAATLAGEMVQMKDWGIFWLMLPLLALAGAAGFRRLPTRALWLLLIGQLAMYVAIYVIAPGDWIDLMNQTADRLLLHVAPAAALLIGWHWADAAG